MRIKSTCVVFIVLFSFVAAVCNFIMYCNGLIQLLFNLHIFLLIYLLFSYSDIYLFSFSSYIYNY